MSEPETTSESNRERGRGRKRRARKERWEERERRKREKRRKSGRGREEISCVRGREGMRERNCVCEDRKSVYISACEVV